jgi:hypothetical protein
MAKFNTALAAKVPYEAPAAKKGKKAKSKAKVKPAALSAAGQKLEKAIDKALVAKNLLPKGHGNPDARISGNKEYIRIAVSTEGFDGGVSPKQITFLSGNYKKAGWGVAKIEDRGEQIIAKFAMNPNAYL